MDSIPIVAFTGQVPTHLIGNDAFQEADNVGITRPCTKHNFLVKDGKDLAADHPGGLPHRRHGRPGPVHVDLPKDILVKEAELRSSPRSVHLRSYNPTYDGHPGQIKQGGQGDDAGASGRCSTSAAASSPRRGTPSCASWPS